MQRLFRILINACAATGLAGAAPAGAVENGSVVPHVAGQPVYRLGHGFDSGTRTFRSACLDVSDFGYAGAPTARLDLDHSLDAAETKTLLGASVSAGIDAFVIGGGVKITVNSHVQSSDTSEILTFAVSNVGKEVLVTEAALSATGLSGTTDPEFARHACGDEYVERIRLGGQLFFTVRYDFGSREVKNEIIKQVKVKAFGFSKTKTSTKRMRDLTERAVVNVDAHQLGGRPERLQAALASVPVKSCTMATIEGCHAIIDRLLAYVNEPGGFSDQMAQLVYDHDAPEHNATVLSYVTKRYHAGGFRQLYPEPAPLVGLEQQAALERLAGELERLEQDRRRGEHLLAVYRLREPHKESLRRALNGPIRHNVNNAMEGVNVCFRAPLRCLASEAAYWRGREGYDEALLHKPITFFDYCIDRQASIERARTVDALLQLAGTSDCGAAEESLETLPSLELRGRGLTDISPLRGLFSLASLDLTDNGLVEIDVLESLVRLQQIRLRDNSVTTMEPLARLPALRELDLSYNAVLEVAPIASAPVLRRLKLHGNPLIDLESLDRSRYELVFLEEDDACAYERDRLVAGGRLARAEADEYAELSMGPIYERHSDPTSAFDWYACSVTAPTYP